MSMTLHESHIQTGIPGGRYPTPQEVARGMKAMTEEILNDGYAGGEPADGNIDFNPETFEKPQENTKESIETTTKKTPQDIRKEIEDHLVTVLSLLDTLVGMATQNEAEKEKLKKAIVEQIMHL